MLPGKYSIKRSSIEFIKFFFDFPDIKKVNFIYDDLLKKTLIEIASIENNGNLIFFF
jgi:hypothetical protein